MVLVAKAKDSIKDKIVDSLKDEKEITKIIIFGSFLHSENPNDIDIAIFQNSDKSYLTLALRYRKLTRDISKIIPLDIIPVKSNVSDNYFLSEVNAGELIYEK